MTTAQDFFTPAEQLRKRSRQRAKRTRRMAILAPTVLVLAGTAAWAWPTEAGCQSQIDGVIVDTLASWDPAVTKTPPQPPEIDRFKVWRCYGESEADMKRIGTKALSGHLLEIMGKAFAGAFSSSSAKP